MFNQFVLLYILISFNYQYIINLEFPYFLFFASKSLHHYDDVSFLKQKIKNTETQDNKYI